MKFFFLQNDDVLRICDEISYFNKHEQSFFPDHHSLGFIYFFYVFFLKRKLPQLMKNFLHFSLDQHHRLSLHRRVIKT